MYTLFISHIHKEASLAKVFKEWLEERTVGCWKVFVSSDKRSNALGDNWFSRVTESLENNSILIALCSPAALQSHWIGYEAGYAAAKGVPIIPICHSGLTFGDLPYFIGNHTGINIDDEDLEIHLFNALHGAAPLLHKPTISKGEIRSKINEAMAQLSSNAKPSGTEDDTDTEYEECGAILKILAKTEKGHSTRYVLAQEMNITQAEVQHYAEILESKGLLSILGNLWGGNGYSLTHEGFDQVLKKGWIDKKAD